ncbi:CLUMA_CG010311, isoform A [Clunio marinus]|uniref:CLUMA_CG010311, isoform A n=1 Tax=Clunio marinus TaxID=568069 RepID=A0A1J1I9S1_9DIPT|nr:CLUMA_CG010311, isoform A [Clunio marinus]
MSKNSTVCIMKLLHFFVIAIIAKEVLPERAPSNACSSDDVGFSPEDISNQLLSIRDYLDGLYDDFLPYFQGQEIESFKGSKIEILDDVASLLGNIISALAEREITISLDSIVQAIEALIDNQTTTGTLKTIEDYVSSANLTNQILFIIFKSVMEALAIETESTADYLTQVAKMEINPADYPISCIAQDLIDFYNFMINLYIEVENNVLQVVEGLRGQ